jgi:hypothetical protein
MARISLEDLVALIKKEPGYKEKWEMEVPAEQALYIRFAKGELQGVKSEVLEAANGAEIVLDRGSDGRIVGIEIL